MKCPVCKTECGGSSVCPECGFAELNPTFLSKEEGDAWVENVVWPMREKYWKTLTEFEIVNKRLVKYKGTQKNADVQVPYGVAAIGDGAFRFCKDVFRISIPDSVERVEDAAFATCWGLRKIVFPKSIEYIGKNFSADELLISSECPNYRVENECLIENRTNTLVAVCRKSVNCVNIPEGVTRIESFAFRDCTSLKVVHIPRSVTTIGECIFIRCNYIAEVVLPDVQEIELGAFSGMGNKKIKMCSDKKGRYVVQHDCLIDTMTNTLVSVCDNEIDTIYIPAATVTIGDSAFECCKQMDTVIFSDGITYIGYNAFARCESLCDIDLPLNLERIGSNAFEGCTSLEYMDIPDSVRHIGFDVFKSCTNLWSVKLSSQMTEIPDGTFSLCFSLSNITIHRNIKEIGYAAFEECMHLHQLIIPSTVEKIDRRAFPNCCNLNRLFCEADKKPMGWNDDWLDQSFTHAHWKTVWFYDENGKPKFIWDDLL